LYYNICKFPFTTNEPAAYVVFLQMRISAKILRFTEMFTSTVHNISHLGFRHFPWIKRIFFRTPKNFAIFTSRIIAGMTAAFITETQKTIPRLWNRLLNLSMNC